MPQSCKVCKHPERQAIDAALLEGYPSLRAIGAQYSVTKDSLLRHWRAHVSVIEEAPQDCQQLSKQTSGDPAPDERGEPRQIAELLHVKKNEEPRRDTEIPSLKNSEELKVQVAEARYRTFIERWRGRLFIKPDEMAEWPFENEELKELIKAGFARGDLFEFGRHYAATAQAVRRFNAEKC